MNIRTRFDKTEKLKQEICLEKINIKKYRIELTQIGKDFVGCCFEKQDAESDNQK